MIRSSIYIFPFLVMFTLFEVFTSSRQQIVEVRESKFYRVPEHLLAEDGNAALYPKCEIIPAFIPNIYPPFLGSAVIGFKEALAFKESSGNYFEVNTLGYLGKYQFGVGTLRTVGVQNSDRFLKDTQLQERAFYTNLSRNKWILRREISRFGGRHIDGIKITESGILAAAHLAGPGNVKRYLISNGVADVKDSYGTRLSDYMYRFSGYDLSLIVGERNPKIDGLTAFSL